MKKAICLLMSVMLVLCLAACGGSGSSSAATPSSTAAPATSDDAGFDTMVIQLAHGDPPTEDNNYHKLAMLFTEYVTEATGGSVTFEIFASGQLGSETEYLDGMQLGTIDMAILTSNGFSDRHQKTGFYDIPFVFKDTKVARAYIDSELNKEVTDEYPDQLGVYVLGWGEGGFRVTFNNGVSIRSMEDYKGLKLRMPSTASFTKSFAALGANPTPMAYSETFTGLSQGAIDGILIPVLTGYSGRYYEVTQYLTLDNSFYNALCVSISKPLFDTLSPELRQVMYDCAVRAGQDQRVFVAESEQAAVEAMKEAGMTVVEDFDGAGVKEALESMYEDTKEKIGEDLFTRSMEFIESYN